MSSRTMENLLMCPVCFDHLDTALMITQCSHNFCALCIRKYLTYQNKCPVCNINAVESDLKNNRLVDRILEQYLQLKNKPEHSAATPEESLEHSVTAQRKVFTFLKTRKENAVSRASQSPRTESAKDIISISDDDEEKVKDSISSNVEDKMEKDQQNKLTTQQARSAAKTDKKFEGKKVTSSTIPWSPQPGPANDQADDPIFSPPGNSSDNKVTCPVCGIAVKQQNVNLHLDSCLSSTEKKSALRRPTPKRKPMAKCVYNIMSEKDLRKKLNEIGLSNKGDKQTLVKRHREFVVMYNAECDSLTPKPVADIVKELERVEKAKEEKTSLFSRTKRLSVNKNSSPDSIDKAQKSYVKHHKSQFDSLVAQARKTRKEHKSAKRGLVTDGANNEREEPLAVDNSSMESSSKQTDMKEGSCQTSGVGAIKDDDNLKDNSSESRSKMRQNILSTQNGVLGSDTVVLVSQDSSADQESAAEMCVSNSEMSQEDTDGNNMNTNSHSENVSHKTKNNSSRPRRSLRSSIVNTGCDSVKRKSLRPKERSATRSMRGSSLSDTDKSIEDTHVNSEGMTDPEDFTEDELKSSSLKKAPRGRKETKSVEKSAKSKVQISYENENRRDSVKRKSLRPKERSAARSVRGSSLSDTDKSVEDTHVNSEDMTDPEDFTEDELKSSSLKKNVRGRKETKSVEKSGKSKVQISYENESRRDSVKRKSLRSKERSATRSVRGSSLSDTDKSVEDTHVNGVDMTDPEDFAEDELKSSSLKKNVRGRKETKSVEKSGKSKVQISYENKIDNIVDNDVDDEDVFQTNNRRTRSKSGKMDDRNAGKKLVQNKDIAKKQEEKEKTVKNKTSTPVHDIQPGPSNTRRSSRRSLCFPKLSENDAKSAEKNARLNKSHVESFEKDFNSPINVKSLKKAVQVSEKKMNSSEKSVSDKIPVISKQTSRRSGKKNGGNDPTENEGVRNSDNDFEPTKDTCVEKAQDSSLMMDQISDICDQEDKRSSRQQNDQIYSSVLTSDEDEHRSLADIQAEIRVLNEKTNTCVSENIHPALLDDTDKERTQAKTKAQKSKSKKGDKKNKADDRLLSMNVNNNSISQKDNGELTNVFSSADESAVRKSPSKQTLSVIEKENIISHSSPVVAGLHCSPLRSLKKSTLSSPKSPIHHLFVDDSESDCGSCDELLHKVNGVIDKFYDDPKEDEGEDNLLGAYTNEWPALGQSTKKTEAVCPSRTRHVSGVSDISGLSTTDSFTSLDSDVSSVLPRLDTSVSVEMSARRSLDSSAWKDNNVTEPRRSKRKRESLTELPSRNKRQRKSDH